MGKNIFETLMGAVVLLIACLFIYIAYSGGKVDDVDGYILSAKFDRVDGLSVGSDVRVSGLAIGKILEQTLDERTFQAIVKFEIRESVKIPTDSSAEIISNGLLGSKYLAIVPGGADDNLKPDGEIKYTQSSISIESLIGKFMFSGGDDKAPEATSDTNDVDEDDIF